VLKQRLISSIIIVPLFVWGILYLQTWHLAFLTGAVMMIAVWEWTRLINIKNPAGKIFYLGVVVTLCSLSMYFINTPYSVFIIMIGVAWWIYIVICIVTSTKKSFALPSSDDDHHLAGAINGILVMIPGWYALITLHGSAAFGGAYVLTAFVVIWAADIGAYTTGKLMGKHRLAPTISPGKTWEGAAGGVAASAVAVVAAGYLLNHDGKFLVGMAAIGILSSMISIFGDLYISMFKRARGLKDTGHAIPGHGGILDRIDSTLAALPVFTVGLYFLENQI
jgi:phosphatidate cytidylyltransferase